MPAPAALADHRVLATLTNDEGRPDGAAVDVEGDYWSAGPSAGCINRFSPHGRVAEQAAVPGARTRRCRASPNASSM